MSQIAGLATPIASTPETDLPAIVLFGCVADGKPRGSWFANTDLKGAKDAAKLTGMKIAMVKPGDLTALARRIPKGRIFSSGKAFAPMIQRSVYEALLPHAVANTSTGKLTLISDAGSGDQDVVHASAPSASGALSSADIPHVDQYPKDWGDITSGHTVLAFSEEDEAWFEAVIVQVLSKDRFTLKWRDYLGTPAFHCQREELGLLYPKRTATA